MAELHVTLVKSTIGVKPKHRGTIRALGLRKIGSSNTLPDRPEIRGMLARVPHLVEVQEMQPGAGPDAAAQSTERAGAGRNRPDGQETQ
jgi:large subunit ribosomal protein L30